MSVISRISWHCVAGHAASEVKEFHRGGKGHADAARKQPQHAQLDDASGERAGMGTTAVDR